jgi:hypothetical protein
MLRQIRDPVVNAAFFSVMHFLLLTVQLGFNSGTHGFSGNPASADIGVIQVFVVATDGN